MKKLLAVLLITVMTHTSAALAEGIEGRPVANIMVVGAATAVADEIRSAEDLSDYFGLEIGNRLMVECVDLQVADTAEGTSKVVFAFAEPVTRGVSALLGITKDGTTAWTETECEVMDGRLSVLFTADLIEAAKRADRVTLAVMKSYKKTSKTTITGVNTPIIEVLGDATKVIEAISAADDLSAFFGVDIGEKDVIECVSLKVSNKAPNAFKAVFDFAVPATEGEKVLLGTNVKGTTTWTVMESEVTNGQLEVLFTEELTAAAKKAKGVTLVVLR